MAYRKRHGTWSRPGPQFAKRDKQSVRGIIRRHLREQCLTMSDVLPKAWGMARVQSVYQKMYRKEPLFPWHIEQFCDALNLDEQERLELRLQGAREAGWSV